MDVSSCRMGSCLKLKEFRQENIETVSVNDLSCLDYAERIFLRHLRSTSGIRRSDRWCDIGVFAGEPGGLNGKNSLGIIVRIAVRWILLRGLNNGRWVLCVLLCIRNPSVIEQTGQKERKYEQQMFHRYFSIRRSSGRIFRSLYGCSRSGKLNRVHPLRTVEAWVNSRKPHSPW